MSLLREDIGIYYKVGAGLVGLVVLAAAISLQFGNSSGVHYTSWFKNIVNSLVDMSENAANRGDQDTDHVMALMDYTTAITILDTLRSIVPDHELQHIAQLNVTNFMQLLVERRQRILQTIGPPLPAPASTSA
jgi:hypothetical protein